MEVYQQDDDESSDDISSRWFKMPSRLWDTEVGGDPFLIQLLAYLCDRARISDGPVSFGEGKGRRNFYLAAGETIVGRHQAAKDLKCAPSTVRNRLRKLAEIGLVKVKPAKNFTLVSIVFLVQDSRKKKRLKKDNRKTTVYPANSLTDEKNGDAKRTDEGQPKNEQFTDELPSESASSVNQKGQMKDRCRTDDGQMMDTNKKDEKVRRKEDEREELTHAEIFSFLSNEYESLPVKECDRLARELIDGIELNMVPVEKWQPTLRVWARATLARLPAVERPSERGRFGPNGEELLI